MRSAELGAGGGAREPGAWGGAREPARSRLGSAGGRRLARATAVAAAVAVAGTASGLGGTASGRATSPRAGAAQVAVFPIPGSRLASAQTQITFRGVPADQLGSITVTGSRSGAHSGQMKADSDGGGGSFVPDSSFVAGEVVTVKTGLNILGAKNGTFKFVVEQRVGGIPPPAKLGAPPRVKGDVSVFRSRPDLRPAAVKSIQGHQTGPDVFLTPMRGPVQRGPLIVGPAGRLVWFHPLRSKEKAADLRVQRYHGQPVLTWWQGYENAGVGKGEDIIVDDHYRLVETVKAGNGLKADLHEFTLTPQGTALITAYRLVRWNASAMGGSKRSAVQDCVVQEIDIPTGLVLFQWDSLDHVPVSDSYSRSPKPHNPYDYFHINSVQQAPDGSLIISARNTWAVYDINHQTGRVNWTIGGKHSSFKMGRGTSTAYQHHARIRPDGLFTIFDDGDAPRVHPQSRGLVERVNLAKRTVTLVRELDHSPKLLTPFEGSVQTLRTGDLFVGWGALPYFTQFTAGGKQIYDGRFVDQNSSYRAYRFVWSATPSNPPAVAGFDSGHRTRVYASWNGATDVSAWRVLAGSSSTALKPARQAASSGFETEITIRRQAYLEVEALGRAGRILGRSGVVTPR